MLGAGEPVVGVAGVAFDEVEEGVEPGAGAAGEVLGDLVGFVPAPGLDEPEGGGFWGEAWGRLGVSEGAPQELGWGHGGEGRGRREGNRRGEGSRGWGW